MAWTAFSLFSRTVGTSVLVPQIGQWDKRYWSGQVRLNWKKKDAPWCDVWRS